MVLHLERFQLLLAPLDLILEFRKWGRVFLAALDVLLQPAVAGLVLREGRDEILARHACIAHADHHDLLLELAHFRHMRAQIQNQRVEHAGRELQLHELFRQLGAQLQRLRIASAGLFDRLENLHVELGDRREARERLRRIRPRVDGFLFAVGAVALSLLFVVGLLFSLDDLQLRGILRLRNHVRRVRVNEADDYVNESRLSGLHRLVGSQNVVVRRRVHGERAAYCVEAFLDALRDPDLAFAREQFHRAHLAHVHTHRIGGASEFRIQRG